MKLIYKTSTLLGLSLSLMASDMASAAVITGDIAFGSAAGVQLVGGDFLTATGLDFAVGPNALVNVGATGSFSALPFPTFATFYDFNFAPLNNPAPLIWTAGAFSFTLQDVSVLRTATSLTLNGSGTVTSGGDTGFGTFAFTTQTAAGSTATRFSFSADNDFDVPDGGATLALLGCSLLGLAAARKSLTA